MKKVWCLVIVALLALSAPTMVMAVGSVEESSAPKPPIVILPQPGEPDVGIPTPVPEPPNIGLPRLPGDKEPDIGTPPEWPSCAGSKS
jgi:hypothetical protein